MNANKHDLYKAIREADMLLIGIGEEFEARMTLQKEERYQEVYKTVNEKGLLWLLPYINTYFIYKQSKIEKKALQSLYTLVKDKDYFVLSTCLNGLLQDSSLDKSKIVEPCGTYIKVQCSRGCEGSVKDTNADILDKLEPYITGESNWESLEIGRCQECGEALVFNNLYAENYMEEGYLEHWSAYTTWLQQTLNKQVCILELGVGMQYPSVIRWPFEKIAFYNQKAVFFRIHEKLCQMTEELSGKGYSISSNAVQFLQDIHE